MNLEPNKWGLVLLIAILSGCNLEAEPKSKKGQWIGEEKVQFRREFENSGLYTELNNKAYKGPYIDSVMEKIGTLIYENSEKQFSSLDELHKEEKEFLKLTDKCFNKVLANGSVKGHWSQDDLNNIDFLTKSIIDESYGKKVKQSEQERFCDCIHAKSQELFPSFYEFSMDSLGMIQLVKQCSGLKIFI
jgi:hypothetical protein